MSKIIKPCIDSKITHGFDEIRIVNGNKVIHGGYDIITADLNRFIYAICDCTIYAAGFSKTFGNRIWVTPTDEELKKKYPYIVYGHLEKIKRYGGFVKQGDIIGIMGNTGMSKGVHLHLEARTEPNMEGKHIKIDEIEELYK